MSEWSGSRLGYRGLWASVVLQALGDIWGQPIGSLDFSQAVAFFTGTGAWAESRTTIGDFLELHRDDLEALGQRCIDARHTRESSVPETLRRSPNELSKVLLNLSGPVGIPQRAKTHAFPNLLHGLLPPAAYPERNGQRAL
jgi:hypothetical protein